jgi:hypothetical protein
MLFTQKNSTTEQSYLRELTPEQTISIKNEYTFLQVNGVPYKLIIRSFNLGTNGETLISTSKLSRINLMRLLL